MSSTMVGDVEASRNIRLKEQLAVAVRSLQWSYAIFWSSSSLIQNGVLEWGEGYYNGEIKRRKKKSYETDSEYGLHRSKQLRNLYMCMLDGNTSHGHGEGHVDGDVDKTSGNVMLSPDDLSDEEWYYLVCMSYVFSPAQWFDLSPELILQLEAFHINLPGKALATGETIWLYNAQHAESGLFTRSLLARSASIQTVVCFPYLGGVIELGVTELIAEDRNLIQHIKDCLLETSSPDFSEMKISEENSKLEEINHQIWSESDEDLQHKKTLSNVVGFSGKSSAQKGYDMKHSSHIGSSFLRWKSSSVPLNTNHHQKKQSNVLLKILHDVPLMHSADAKGMFQTETTGLNQCVSMEYDDDKTKENEKFSVLKSMVPTVNEVDKESILNNTIKYLQELEARVEELESRITQIEPTMKENIISESVEESSETEQVMVRDETDVRVELKESEVLIEVRCIYRDYIVADIMEALSNLNMDASSIRSKNQEGFLVLNLKAKFRGAAITSVGMIKRELKRVTCDS